MDLVREIEKALRIEKEAIEVLILRDHQQAVAAVETIYSTRGRVITTGIGKAGLVGRKFAATLSSIGKPSFFMHPVEAFHGDLGLLTKQDVVIIFSYSGNTKEIKKLIPYFKSLGVKIVAITGQLDSELAKKSDLVLDTAVAREADPLNTIPTSSTTAMLAMSDALAVALSVKGNLTAEQFSNFHPGGVLGNRIQLRVDSLMHTGGTIPLVKDSVDVREAVCEMSAKKLGATLIVDNFNCLLGIFTDGDLRRLLEKEENPLIIPIIDVMTENPVTLRSTVLAIEALKLMEKHLITLIPIVDDNLSPLGVIHLHSIVGAGLK